MTLELIAVLGCTIAHSAGSTITGGAFVITTPPSVKTLGESKGVYRGPIVFTFSGGSAPGVTAGTVVGAGTIAPTATKTLADSLAVVRQGDTGTLTGAGTNPSPPPPTLPVSGPVEITVAGQTKATAQ